jgi:hypothetical protein
MVIPDKYHLLLVPDFNLTSDCHNISLTSHHKFAQGDYPLLYNILDSTDWSCVLNGNSIDSAVHNLTAIVREAVNLGIPYI